MISSAIYARYARALSDVALETGEDQAIGRELGIYKAIFEAVPDVLEAFHSPAVAHDAKEKMLTDLMALYPVGRTTENFLRVLVGHYRIRYFREIADAYVKTVEERHGIVSARVVSATPLDEGSLTRLREALAKTTGKSVRLDVRADPELLGGVIVQVGSTVYDGSVRSQLAELRGQLTGR